MAAFSIAIFDIYLIHLNWDYRRAGNGFRKLVNKLRYHLDTGDGYLPMETRSGNPVSAILGSDSVFSYKGDSYIASKRRLA